MKSHARENLHCCVLLPNICALGRIEPLMGVHGSWAQRTDMRDGPPKLAGGHLKRCGGPRRHSSIGERGGLEPGTKLVPERHIGVVLIVEGTPVLKPWSHGQQRERLFISIWCSDGLCMSSILTTTLDDISGFSENLAKLSLEIVSWTPPGIFEGCWKHLCETGADIGTEEGEIFLLMGFHELTTGPVTNLLVTWLCTCFKRDATHLYMPSW